MSETNRNDGHPIYDRLSGRRDFLKWTGAGVAAVAAAACSEEATRLIVEVAPVIPPPAFASATLDFANDLGVQNYAYMIEQLEAAFYTLVVGSAAFQTTFDAGERVLLTDLRDHAIVHREYLKAALGSNAIINLTFEFLFINPVSRLNVLQTAQAIEDLGVLAYNGAAQYLASADALAVLGKIASVEGRHAAAVRDVLVGPAFNSSVLDVGMKPADVVAALDPYILNTIILVNVPT